MSTTPHPERPALRRVALVATAGAVSTLLATGVPLTGSAEETPKPMAPVDLVTDSCQAFNPPATAAMPKPWQVDRLKLAALRKQTVNSQPLDGRGVKIAVLDTAVQNRFSAYYDQRNVTSRTVMPTAQEDAEGISCEHGTAVTSLIVGKPGVDSRTAFAGIAPGAHVYGYRTLRNAVDQEGKAQSDDPSFTIAAIKDVVKNRATTNIRVINISQAMSQYRADYADAVKSAIEAGIVVVAAAGNNSNNLGGKAYPASYPGVISVGMTDPQDNPSKDSYAGTRVDVAAPGAGVMVLRPSKPTTDTSPEALVKNQSYAEETGTSFATPLVSGLVALMLQAEPKLTPAQVRLRLIQSADQPPTGVPDRQVGYGVINPQRAINGPFVQVTPRDDAVSPAPQQPYVPPPPENNTPRWIALGIGAGAGLLALVGLVLRLTLPPAAKRNFSSAKR